MVGPTIEIYADTRGRAPCRGAHCGVMLTWAEVVATGRRMPFTGDPVVLQTRHDEAGRLIEVLELAANHWRDCPDSRDFKRR